MGLARFFRRAFGSRTFRGEVLHCLVEVRINASGGETVIVDGKPMSNHPWAYYSGNHDHFFTVTGDDGIERHVEVRVEDRSGGLQAALRVAVNVDGKPLTLLPETEPSRYTRCAHCEYDLHGLEPVNGEVTCAECGRHTGAKILAQP